VSANWAEEAMGTSEQSATTPSPPNSFQRLKASKGADIKTTRIVAVQGTSEFYTAISRNGLVRPSIDGQNVDWDAHTLCMTDRARPERESQPAARHFQTAGLDRRSSTYSQ
jgi:hypothetical protein